MDFINRLLKSSIKTCISKYLKNDLNLSQMQYQEGAFALSDITLNCDQINKQIEFEVPFYCQQIRIGSMKLHPSFSTSLIHKIELDRTYVQLSQEYIDNPSPPTSTNTTLPTTTPIPMPSTANAGDSIFFNKNPLLQDSLSASIADIVNSDFGGYQTVLENVEKITKEFVLAFTCVTLEYKDLQVYVDKIVYEQKQNTIDIDITGVTASVSGVLVAVFPHLNCSIKPGIVSIRVPENVEAKVTVNFEVLVTIIRYIGELTKMSTTVDKDTFSGRSHVLPKFDISVPRLTVQVGEDVFQFEDTALSKDPTLTHIKVKNVTSRLLNTSGLSLRIITVNCGATDNTDNTDNTNNTDNTYSTNANAGTTSSIPTTVATTIAESSSPFSDTIRYYEENCITGLSSQSEQELYKEQQRNTSAKHIICTAKTTWIEWQPFFKLVKGIITTITTPATTTVPMSSQSSTPMTTTPKTPKKWFEIQVDTATIVCTDVLTFVGNGVALFLGSHFWNIETKTASWTPLGYPVCQVTDIHCAATRTMDQFVVNADKCVLLDSSEIYKRLLPYLQVESKPLTCQLNIKLKHLIAPSVLHTELHTVNLIGQGLEIFTTGCSGGPGSAMNVVLQKGILKLGDAKIIGVTMVHVNQYNDTHQTKFHIGSAKCDFDASHIKLALELFSKYTQPSNPNNVSDSATYSTNHSNENEVTILTDADSQFQLIEDYRNTFATTVQCALVEGNVANWCVQLKNKEKWDTTNYIALKGSDLEIQMFSRERIEINLPKTEIIDGIKSSLWYKAAYTNNMKIVWIDDYVSFELPCDVYLNIDQNFLIFVNQLFDWELDTCTTATSPQKRAPFSSIHISESTFRLDYKPKQSAEFLEFVNFVPLRNAKVVFREFYMFNITSFGELTQKLMVNLLANLRNVQGVVAGMKAVKPIAKILANAKNIIILPVNTKLDKNYITNLKAQLTTLTKNTTIEILELGCGLNVTLRDTTSVYSNQPGTVSEGFQQARTEFSNGMDTVFAFVRNSEDLDIMSLPIAVVKPFTGSFSKILLGICNHLDPERKKRMDAKYK